MFLLVLLYGFITLTLSVPRQYVFVNKSKTWAEAQRYCRDKYTDLATIKNEQQTIQLLDTVNDDSIDLAWIGLYDDLKSWRWTLEDRDFFKAGEKEFRNWNNLVPNNYGGQRLCVYIYSGIWYMAYCTEICPFICYDGRQNSSASYVFIHQHKTWTEAQSYCREHHTDLVSIRNEIENYRVQSRSWSDQSNSSFSNWRSGQPDNAGNSEYCTAVSFSDSGSWTDENCNITLPFFCYSVSLLGSSCQYYFVNQSLNWTEAQRFCRQNYTDLATIDKMEEMNRLINTVNGSYSGSAWLVSMMM
ncbi:macrophage mannose receptor 1-like [Danio rerio]|uniref:Macrophage mannose receptor 1-like n=1 Tax=Danio rerio TaxID=7955 RepID=A0AC58ID90_DANRE